MHVDHRFRVPLFHLFGHTLPPPFSLLPHLIQMVNSHRGKVLDQTQEREQHADEHPDVDGDDVRNPDLVIDDVVHGDQGEERCQVQIDSRLPHRRRDEVSNKGAGSDEDCWRVEAGHIEANLPTHAQHSPHTGPLHPHSPGTADQRRFEAIHSELGEIKRLVNHKVFPAE